MKKNIPRKQMLKNNGLINYHDSAIAWKIAQHLKYIYRSLFISLASQEKKTTL
jgi:hypothetical protein